jgi:nicotinamide riboside kinase
MYVMKVWSEYVFKQVDPFIVEQIGSREYDLYLLCDIDLEWTEDPLREYPDIEDRRVLFHIYRNLLENQRVPWRTISGPEEERLLKAIHAVENILKP